MTRGLARRRDGGETLIEILIAIEILGIAATGLVSALSSGIFASDAHRRISTAESVLRAYGELVKNKIIHPPSTTLTNDVGPYSSGDTLTISVANASVFTDTANFTVSLDGAEMTVKPSDVNTGTNTISGKVLAGGSSRAGDVVQRYEACPTKSYWDGVLASHPELKDGLAADNPQVVSDPVFFDNSGTAVTCADPRGSGGSTTCANTTDWRTSCDPPWMRVSISVTRSTAGRTTQSAATDVVIRRVP